MSEMAAKCCAVSDRCECLRQPGGSVYEWRAEIEAITNYKKSLKLDPKNDNAVKMLEKLGVNWTPAANTTE